MRNLFIAHFNDSLLKIAVLPVVTGLQGVPLFSIQVEKVTCEITSLRCGYNIGCNHPIIGGPAHSGKDSHFRIVGSSRS